MSERTTNPHIRRGPAAGATLIEVLVAALLLSLSMAALLQLWGVSRRITERSRDTGEQYAVARREAERDKATLFRYLFQQAGPAYVNGTTRRTDYGADGALLATGLAAGAAPTAGAFYRARSTYSLVRTGTETAARQQLGVQEIEVFARDGAGFGATPVYETTVFYTSPGV